MPAHQPVREQGAPGGCAAGALDVSAVIEPIGVQQQGQVRKRTEYFIACAEDVFEQRFRRVPVRFDLSGTTAGMFRLHGRRGEIRYNPWIFAKYFEENLRDTVPHEVAHYIIYAVFGDHGVKPHGPEWRDLMTVFGADPEVTFNMDLEGIPQRRQRTHPYHCGCRLHELSSTRHNRVQRRRGQYQCRVCNGTLVYSPQLQLPVY